ncbi:hypothetical protein EAH86_09710 [Pedococcus bigeumensis]|uniref:Uncharacterized protein n=1 Tax=Pedococcus bigeumensis TaxID=433644 RepID=A0A502CWK9_9MICO|nr:hypothetical protein EAH86_09710 [Pedococcus bigeumensis]
MRQRDPWAGIRPRPLGRWLALWTALAVIAGIYAAANPDYGSLYLLMGPGAYLLAQLMFRLSLNLEQVPTRRRNWLFLP